MAMLLLKMKAHFFGFLRRKLYSLSDAFTALAVMAEGQEERCEDRIRDIEYIEPILKKNGLSMFL